MGTVSQLPPPRRAGILSQVREDAFRDGWNQAASQDDTSDFTDVDDAYVRGVADGEARVRFDWRRWLAAGFVIGCVAGYFSGYLL